MKVWIDKSGKKITASEFKERFKQGIMSITPLQQAKGTQRTYYIMLIGIIIGVYQFFANKQWGLMIVMTASMVLMIISMLGNWQKIQTLKMFEIKPEEKPIEVKSYVQ